MKEESQPLMRTTISSNVMGSARRGTEQRQFLSETAESNEYKPLFPINFFKNVNCDGTVSVDLKLVKIDNEKQIDSLKRDVTRTSINENSRLSFLESIATPLIIPKDEYNIAQFLQRDIERRIKDEDFFVEGAAYSSNNILQSTLKYDQPKGAQTIVNFPLRREQTLGSGVSSSSIRTKRRESSTGIQPLMTIAKTEAHIPGAYIQLTKQGEEKTMTVKLRRSEERRKIINVSDTIKSLSKQYITLLSSSSDDEYIAQFLRRITNSVETKRGNPNIFDMKQLKDFAMQLGVPSSGKNKSELIKDIENKIRESIVVAK